MSNFNINEHHVMESPMLSFGHISQSSKADSRKRDKKQGRTHKPTSCSVSHAKKSKPNIETLTDDLFPLLDITDSESDLSTVPCQSMDLYKTDLHSSSLATTTESDGGTPMPTDSESAKEMSTDDQKTYPIWVREPKATTACCSGWGYRKVMSRFAKSPKKSTAKPIRIGQIYRVYGKYFNKFGYDNTVVLGHVLYAMILSSGYYKWRHSVLEHMEGLTEAMVVCEQRLAKTLHSNRLAILTAKAQTYFAAVVSTFDDSDFKPAFWIFINCLLTVVRSLQGNLHYTRVKLVQLLCSCLTKEVDDPRACALLTSNRFISDCSEVADVVNKAQKPSQHAEENMLLFESFAWVRICVQHFQPVISIIVRTADLDLESAITKAANDIFQNSTFVDKGQVHF